MTPSPNQTMQPTAAHSMHAYEVRPRRGHRGVDLISDVLPFGGLWYAGSNAITNAISYAMHSSRSHAAVIRVYDDVIESSLEERANTQKKPGSAGRKLQPIHTAMTK